MRIDFSAIAPVAIPHFHNGKLEAVARAFADDDARIMLGTLRPGASIGPHRHSDSAEIVYVLSGTGVAVCDGQKEMLCPGICHYCPRGSEHGMENTGSEDLVIFTVIPQLGSK